MANSQVQPRDDWEVMYIGEAKIGFSHTTVTIAGEGAAQTVKTTSDNEMTFNRFGQTVTMTIQIASEEKPDGTPLSFSAIQQVGPSESVSTGTWTANSVTIEARTLDKKESKTIAWRPELGGVFAKDQSLQRKPLQPGEQRTLTALFPVMNKLGEIRFKAQDYETTKLLSGEASLLKVDCTEILGTERIGSTLWVDKNGEVQKQYLPQLKQTSYRTTREIATGKSNGPKFDLGDTTIVKIKKGIARPHQTQQIIYKATLPAGEIAEAFVSGPSQSLKLLDKHTAELTVRAIRPHEPKELAEKDSPPTDDDREPNNLVQCDDKLVVEMANSVVPGEKDPWKVAVALERYVRGIIKTKNFSQAFASAAEVAKNKEGDCTEHAVLLAALCRARGIPARGAMGLVYYAPSGGFAYHMWTEVWIDDRWIPLDATLAQGGIGAAHLKIAQSNLKGADALSAFLPVFRVLGQLELEVIATKP
ncbi:MAG TPA: transglutaminase-like domain-containing protein [Pirellulaceae bacterium]|nr:transglutaminase-like domain-containing protein [Pirellulaceae bacterium]